MMLVGDFIREKRIEKGLTRNKLAVKAGISHTEVKRIEANERKMPSLKVIIALAEALNIPQEDILRVAGYEFDVDLPGIERAFPGLKTKKLQQTAEKIVDDLTRNPDFTDKDLDDLCDQVEMFMDFARKKRNLQQNPV